MVDPRLMATSTKTVEVQAAHNTKRLAVRLQWEAADKHDVPGSARFADACAIQLPVRIGAQLPAPQMGDAKHPVQISYWSAFWQATVDGRPDTINAIYPGARVDHYPFQAAPLKPGSPEQRAMERRYAPARALGNTMAGPRKQPVEDLVADGPGTLRPAQRNRSAGVGRHSGGRWRVVIHRPLPAGLGPGGQSQLAVAIWQGARQEVGARKMRSVWIPLSLGAAK